MFTAEMLPFFRIILFLFSNHDLICKTHKVSKFKVMWTKCDKVVGATSIGGFVVAFVT